MLEVEGLTAGYAEADVLQDVSLTVSSAELLCVLGPSGGGKSTCCG